MFRAFLPESTSTKRCDGVRAIDAVAQIPPGERAELEEVTNRYPLHANTYYLDLIDWHDQADPIRQLIIPQAGELTDWGDLDPSNESAVTVAPGVQHKYDDTVLLLCSRVCGASCRYCFRKRLFMDENDGVADDLSEGLAYVAKDSRISDVLLTGGDPLAMSTQRLVGILRALRDIPHVKIIRIGSKMPAFAPWRLLDDFRLQETFRELSTRRKRIYLMAHFDHPRELTDAAIEGIDCFIRNGVICVNQCPLIRGINDDPEVLATMFRRLSFIGCPPYYLFNAARLPATRRTRSRSCAAGRCSTKRFAKDRVWHAARGLLCRTKPGRSRFSQLIRSTSTCDIIAKGMLHSVDGSWCTNATTRRTGSTN